MNGGKQRKQAGTAKPEEPLTETGQPTTAKGKTDWKHVAVQSVVGLLAAGWGFGYAVAKTMYGAITVHDALVTYIPVLVGLLTVLNAWKTPVSLLMKRVGGALGSGFLRFLRFVGRETIRFTETLTGKHRRD